MWLPENRDKLAVKATEWKDQCRDTSSRRLSQAHSLRQWYLTGSNDGSMAIYNKLIEHIPRISAYVYSAQDLEFQADFEALYPKLVYQQGDVGARVLTREWDRRDIDINYGHGVTESFVYGSALMKSLWANGGLSSRIILPWCFGVFNESQNDLRKQEAVCESTYITTHELWRRIQHLPDAAALYKRAVQHSKKNSGGDYDESYFHTAILSGSSPGIQYGSPYSNQPGGFVDIASDYAVASLSPVVGAGLIAFHELWVWDDGRADYTTIQLAEPDILIAPRYKRSNLFVEGSQSLPYGLVQANRMEGYFWGRSELMPLMKLQAMLRDGLIDIKKLLSVQFDRILAFKNYGMNDERYDQLRRAGWIANDESGAEVQDLTPQMPNDAFKYIDDVIRFMNEASGFQPILTGEGEQGVRAGNHAQTLLRNASPHLRNRALLIERQLADFGHTTFDLMKAKDDQAYWTTADEKETEASEFLLSQLPDDLRMSVSSHKSSPIYQADNTQMAFALAKSGVIDGDGLLDLVNVPMKDRLRANFHEMQRKKEEMMQKYPWAFMNKDEGKKKAAGG